MGSSKQNPTDTHDRIMKVIFALLGLVACVSAGLFDCSADTGMFYVEVCCSLTPEGKTTKVEKVHTSVRPADDTCSCEMEEIDWEKMVITYSCQCLGYDLASCSTDIKEDIEDHFKVCCKFGIGE